ncbi:MAG: hypothetical protein ACJAVI_004273 [Candidatus Azotimanducaceae bacterium]|jgi:hypothetical protein
MVELNPFIYLETEKRSLKMAVDQSFEKQEAWINQVVEAALEPELPICDAHHHF